MASRTLLYFTKTTGESVSLTIEQASNGASVFEEATVVAFAESIKPEGMELSSVRFSPEFETLFPE